MIFPECDANTDVTCLQLIAKKEVIVKNRVWACPLRPPLNSSLSIMYNKYKITKHKHSQTPK